MSHRKLLRGIKGVGFLTALVISLWIATMDLKPDHLTVNLHTDSQQERRIVVYFLKGFEPIGSAIRQASEPSVSKNYYFKFSRSSYT